MCPEYKNSGDFTADKKETEEAAGSKPEIKDDDISDEREKKGGIFDKIKGAVSKGVKKVKGLGKKE
jgi:hypothetical protein